MRATVANLAAAEQAETNDGAWLDRVQAVCLAPAELAERLHDLAEVADIAQGRADLVTPDGALRLLRDTLRDLAWQVEPS
jgi:hypothetical protein